VPNDDPLRFYRAIASFAVEALSQGGHIYYEINPLFATEMLEMMRGMGYNDIEIINDMQGRKRMLCARK
jgi:release factor glutamine methyltransferase